MNLLIKIFILIPLVGFAFNILLPEKKENIISWSAVITIGLHLSTFVVFLVWWFWEGHPSLDTLEFVVYKTKGYRFFIDFYFDKISATYMLVGAFLTFLVAIYSRSYLHREEGYKRFFNTILMFYVGYNFIVLAGNFETMFIGWEILGISSFLLIAFYRNRYLPVKNAVKVFSIYRIGDVGLLLAMWMSHHLWHENITFLKLNNYELVHDHLLSHSYLGVVISMMILIAAAAKSAQLPFSSWLPRAMEGPTPSSAIFYGALSVHIGVFLMLRTFPFWEHQFSVRLFIVIMGLTTSIVASFIARVQSSIKSQIAYSSISQIGLIFIEVALGFETLALIHFAGNAFLRTYQLLVSPSAVTYLIREQFYNFIPRPLTLEDSFPKKIEYSFYILCLQEWNLDTFMYRFLWNPLKRLGKQVSFISVKNVLFFFIPAYLIGIALWLAKDYLPNIVSENLPILYAVLGLMMVLKSFTERIHARMSFIMIIMNHFWVALAISFNENFSFDQIELYLSGIVVAGIIGYACLMRIKKFEGNIDLNQFHGHSYKHPKVTLLFLMACLGVTGFPITPTFLGEDLIFTHIREDQFVLTFLVSLCFIIDGFAIIRIFARIFLGPHSNSKQEMAFRSS